MAGLDPHNSHNKKPVPIHPENTEKQDTFSTEHQPE
jgi:hypothetical protein